MSDLAPEETLEAEYYDESEPYQGRHVPLSSALAAVAAERERIVKALREAAHGGNRGQPGSFWVGWRAAARAIEEGWAEKPETDT